MDNLRTLTKEQLIDFSGEHLYYELTMLFGVHKCLNQGVHDQFVYSALLESFVIHSSVILDFFYKPPRKYDDASVVHFIKDMQKWRALRPSYDKYFRKFHRRRSREVVHLSYKRLDVPKEEKVWNLEKMVPPICELVRVFLQTANPDYLHPKIYDVIKYVDESE